MAARRKESAALGASSRVTLAETGHVPPVIDNWTLRREPCQFHNLLRETDCTRIPPGSCVQSSPAPRNLDIILW